MDLNRLWKALTTGERAILAASALLVALLLAGGAVALGLTPFEAAQTEAEGGTVADADDDGVSDAEERLLYGTDPNDPDTDGDGLPDGWEVQHMQIHPNTGLLAPEPTEPDAELDPNDDGLVLREEFEIGVDPWREDTTGDGFPDAFLHRSGLDPTETYSSDFTCADDGMTIEEKLENGLSACSTNADEDGLTDREEIQGQATIAGESFSFQPTDPADYSTGGSGLADGFAVFYGLDPHDPNVGRIDHSGDGLSAAQEARYSIERFNDTRTAIVEGLDLTDPDTDGDGLEDGWEISNGLDPLDEGDAAEDPDEDGLSNRREFEWGTDPLTPDTDGDGLEDGTEVDGWTIEVDGREKQVNSNPLLEDTSGEGLTDFEEQQGQAEINGTTVTFNRTDPRLPDTDGDGLDDYTEIQRTFGPEDARLDPTLKDTAGSGIPDGEELAYWQDRRSQAEDEWPDAIQPPERGSCQAAAEAAINSQDPSVFGPEGDPDGDCIPNVLDPVSAHHTPNPDLPPGTQPVLDGDQIDPPTRGGRQLPTSDPALESTNGDELVDDWILRWASYESTVDGQPTWLPDPNTLDADGNDVPDAEDDFEGADHVDGTPSCWEDLVGVEDGDRTYGTPTGDGVPSITSAERTLHPYTNADEMQTGTVPLGERACDSDRDGLVDGWEAAYTQAVHLDPSDPLGGPLEGAIVQTACYPGSRSDPSLETVSEVARAVDVAQVPDSGPAPTDLDPTLLPREDRDQPRAWWVQGVNGCSWDTSAKTAVPGGSECDDCQVVGIVATLEVQQNYLTNPTTDDTNGNGASDAWELLWHALARGDQRDASNIVHPAEDRSSPTESGGSLSEVEDCGGSPLVADSSGDGTPDGSADLCLSAGDAIRIKDDDGDHQLDSACDSGTPGVVEPEGADRRRSMRELPVVELEDGVFLCEGRVDADGESVDADDDGMPDVLERLQTYRWSETDAPRQDVLGVNDDEDGDGIRDAAELGLGRPAEWPAGELWWFGSFPFAENGYDADGDGLREALHLDPDPFTNVQATAGVSELTPANAWSVACQAGIVCPQDTTFSWDSTASEPGFDVTLEAVGEASGGNRLITKGAEDLDARVQVNDSSGNPASNVPVALLALTANEANRLDAGDLSELTRPERAICIQTTDADGIVETSGCNPVSSNASASLEGTDRSWLGSSTPSWGRDLAVLDPTESDDNEASPENQPRVVAWAMGTADALGDADSTPVVVDSTATIEPSSVPESASSGDSIAVTVRPVDAGGDPLAEGSLSLATGDTQRERSIGDTATTTFEDVPMPNVTEAQTVSITVSYQLSPATYVPVTDTTFEVEVLPRPTVTVDPPSSATANESLDAGVRVLGPEGAPAQGPVEVRLAGANTTVQTDADGQATATLSLPADISPGTQTLEATFLGNDRIGEGSAQQSVPVLQKLTADVGPTELALDTDTRFSVDVTDLAGRPVTLRANATLALGGVQDTVEIPAGETLASAVLPIQSEVGPTTLDLNVHTQDDRNYEPLQQSIPVTVTTPVSTSVDRQQVPRGETVPITIEVLDALDRGIPEGEVSASWDTGSANVSLSEGTAEIPFSTPPDAPPEPTSLTYTVEGPGIARTQERQGLLVQVETNLTADVEVDPVTGIVNVNALLVDDRGDPVPAASLRANWELGDPVQAETDADGRAAATLVVPDEVDAGDQPVTVTFPGDSTFQAAETLEQAPLRTPTTVEVPDTVVWAQDQALEISGRVQTAGGEVVRAPVEATHGGQTVASSSGGDPFNLRIPPETVRDFAGAARTFTLEVSTPGDDVYAPADTTVLVERRIPVSLTTGVEERDPGVLVRIQASTPDGPLSGATVSVGQENGPPLTVELGPDGNGTVRLEEGTGTLVVRYGGDEAHTAAQSSVNLAEPAAPTATTYGGLVAMAVIALIALDAWIVYRVVQRVRVGQQVDEMLEELEERLVLGDEVEAAIYQAYLRWKTTAEVLGTPEDETETVREFGDRFIDHLSLDPSRVEGLIDVFEQAWYGEVHPDLRTTAIEELRDLQDHLREKGLVA